MSRGKPLQRLSATLNDALIVMLLTAQRGGEVCRMRWEDIDLNAGWCTAASSMGEAGVDRFHIAHVLNHRSVTHSTVTAIYDRYRYDKEKRAALETWTRLLAEVVKPEAAVPV